MLQSQLVVLLLFLLVQFEVFVFLVAPLKVLIEFLEHLDNWRHLNADYYCTFDTIYAYSW